MSRSRMRLPAFCLGCARITMQTPLKGFVEGETDILLAPVVSVR
jgi:hypothetical protein